MLDYCLSALTTAWVVTFVATTALFAALAMDSVWDKQAYLQELQDVMITESLPVPILAGGPFGDGRDRPF